VLLLGSEQARELVARVADVDGVVAVRWAD
jgi:hypothetical protein